MEVNINSAEIQQIIQSQTSPAIQKVLSTSALEQYSQKTQKEAKEILQKLILYKNRFLWYREQLKKEVPLETYLSAYEFILEFRKFILGEKLGAINYTFIVTTYEKQSGYTVHNVELSAKQFSEVISSYGGKFLLFEDSIKFPSQLQTDLKKAIQIAKNLEKKASFSKYFPFDVKIGNELSFTDEETGIKIRCSDKNFFISYLQSLASAKGRISMNKRHQIKGTNGYYFLLEHQGGRIITTNARGAIPSSSIFSAVGKYLKDEFDAKTTYYNMQQSSSDKLNPPSYPNAGNFTELYIVAKSRLNGGKNKFGGSRQKVSGKDLFELYKQVKSNTDAFYTGGDYLTDQIKGFLGALPSLTSLKTIKNAVENFYQALKDVEENIKNIDHIKKELSKLLLQDESTSKKISDTQRNLSKDLAVAFEKFFSNLTN